MKIKDIIVEQQLELPVDVKSNPKVDPMTQQEKGFVQQAKSWLSKATKQQALDKKSDIASKKAEIEKELANIKDPKLRKKREAELKKAMKIPSQEQPLNLPDPVIPKKTIKAYKLFAVKGKDKNIYPLFIGASIPVEIGKWLPAEYFPTEGFAVRPGWHSGDLPMAPHLRTADGKIQPNRVWAEIEVPNDIDWQSKADEIKAAKQTQYGDIKDTLPHGGFYRFKTNPKQTESWIISGSIRVNKILSDKEVASILIKNGHPKDAQAETHTDISGMLK